jgi:hypothetical protein
MLRKVPVFSDVLVENLEHFLILEACPRLMRQLPPKGDLVLFEVVNETCALEFTVDRVHLLSAPATMLRSLCNECKLKLGNVPASEMAKALLQHLRRPEEVVAAVVDALQVAERTRAASGQKKKNAADGEANDDDGQNHEGGNPSDDELENPESSKPIVFDTTGPDKTRYAERQDGSDSDDGADDYHGESQTSDEEEAHVKDKSGVQGVVAGGGSEAVPAAAADSCRAAAASSVSSETQPTVTTAARSDECMCAPLLEAPPLRHLEAPPDCRISLRLPLAGASAHWVGLLPKGQAYQLQKSVSRSFDAETASSDVAGTPNAHGKRATLSDRQAQELVHDWLWGWFRLSEEEKKHEASEFYRVSPSALASVPRNVKAASSVTARASAPGDADTRGVASTSSAQACAKVVKTTTTTVPSCASPSLSTPGPTSIRAALSSSSSSSSALSPSALGGSDQKPSDEMAKRGSSHSKVSAAKRQKR